MKVGQWQEFTIGNFINLPGGERQIVMIASNGMRHLIPAAYYSSYNFYPQKKVLCKIDKINCSGKVFLEPQHPYYQENNWYKFNFYKKQERKDVFGIPEYFWVLKDVFDKEVDLKIKQEYFELDPAEFLECQVIRIKKAVLFLKHPYSFEPPVNSQNETWLKLLLLNETVSIDNSVYFILQQNEGERFLLKKEHYKNYGFKIGDFIKCRLVKWSLKGRWIVEPEHPIYKLGEKYQFCIQDIENEADEDFSLAFYVVDIENNKIQVKIPFELSSGLSVGQNVELQVTDIRKAIPRLEWVIQSSLIP